MTKRLRGEEEEEEEVVVDGDDGDDGVDEENSLTSVRAAAKPRPVHVSVPCPNASSAKFGDKFAEEIGDAESAAAAACKHGAASLSYLGEKIAEISPRYSRERADFSPGEPCPRVTSPCPRVTSPRPRVTSPCPRGR